jgi:hypothetical protein
MKTIINTLAGMILCVSLLTSCKKYEEGPAFSLRSKTERVANTWRIEYAWDRIDSVNITTDCSGETWEFTKKNDFVKRDNGIVDKTGSWEFVSNKEQITIRLPLTTHTYEILRLKEKELWLRDSEEELHLVPGN